MAARPLKRLYKLVAQGFQSAIEFNTDDGMLIEQCIGGSMVGRPVRSLGNFTNNTDNGILGGNRRPRLDSSAPLQRTGPGSRRASPTSSGATWVASGLRRSATSRPGPAYRPACSHRSSSAWGCAGRTARPTPSPTTGWRHPGATAPAPELGRDLARARASHGGPTRAVPQDRLQPEEAAVDADVPRRRARCRRLEGGTRQDSARAIRGGFLVPSGASSTRSRNGCSRSTASRQPCRGLGGTPQNSDRPLRCKIAASRGGT